MCGFWFLYCSKLPFILLMLKPILIWSKSKHTPSTNSSIITFHKGLKFWFNMLKECYQLLSMTYCNHISQEWAKLIFLMLIKQVIIDKGYDGAKADLWSCGVVLFVLMAGYLPFDEPNIMNLYKKVICFWEMSKYICTTSGWIQMLWEGAVWGPTFHGIKPFGPNLPNWLSLPLKVLHH